MTNPNRAKIIQDIIDDNSVSYAHAYLMKPSNGYAHMHCDIHMTTKDSWRRHEGVIRISCQIGGDSDFCQKPYAEKFGFDPRYGDGSLEELEQAVKVMRRIQKKLDEFYNELGKHASFADYAQRCLLGSGAKWLIANPYQWTNGGCDAKQMELFSVGAESRHRLAQMEEELILGITRKVA